MTETIKGSVVLITGATGAIAQALIAALKARGAAKIYAAARDISTLATSDHWCRSRWMSPATMTLPRQPRLATDVTLSDQQCRHQPQHRFMTAPDLVDGPGGDRVNYLAPLRVTRAFAPALIKNHGAVLNMLTILSRVNLPFMGSYCASKAAGSA